MSTRSGKRIHGSSYEQASETGKEDIFKSERKTKSKQQRDDSVPPKGKKRQHYVSYPVEKGINVGLNDGVLCRGSRATLKEQNLNVSQENNISDSEVTNGKLTRQSRRTKKFAENAGDGGLENVVGEQMVQNKKKSKKNKKNMAQFDTVIENVEETVVVTKKSKKKKKKGYNSEIDKLNHERVLNTTLDKSNGSVDSFHSAAGSPVIVAPSIKVTKPDTSFGKSPRRASKRLLNGSHEPENVSLNEVFTSSKRVKLSTEVQKAPVKTKRSSRSKASDCIKLNSTLDKSNTEIDKALNVTFEKESDSKLSIKDATFEKTESPVKALNSTYEKDNTLDKLNVTYEQDLKSNRKSLRLSTVVDKQVDKVSLNSTFERQSIVESALNTTFDKEIKLNSTFDKTETKSISTASAKSSIISSDATLNVTFDKSDENSRISITSDESRTENIVNITPVLIESSLDESQIELLPPQEKTSENYNLKASVTPIKREGTFTKDRPDVVLSPKPKLSTDKTPIKCMSLPSPGCTPFHVSKSSKKDKSIMNVTHSIEKTGRRSSLMEPVQRTTKVMFCSPVNNPAVVQQQKRKVIKSNLKGSNKSFIFDESVSEVVRPAARKRSYTHNDADEARAKRTRLAGHLQQAADRLSRPRTASVSAKQPEPSTASKKLFTPTKKNVTPSKTKSESKVSRTKLPNFAALHQKQFSKMESLDECQERKARRAKQLLTPTAVPVERSSPKIKGPTIELVKPVKEAAKKDIASKTLKLPTLESLRPGFTRFGFKMHLDNNPFSVPPKPDPKPREKRPNGVLTRLPAHPSLAGATSRRDIAKQTVMKEKSFTSLSEKRDVKRKENRTMIKGVRTNRRFELQMKMRNVNS